MNQENKIEAPKEVSPAVPIISADPKKEERVEALVTEPLQPQQQEAEVVPIKKISAEPVAEKNVKEETQRVKRAKFERRLRAESDFETREKSSVELEDTKEIPITPPVPSSPFPPIIENPIRVKETKAENEVPQHEAKQIEQPLQQPEQRQEEEVVQPSPQVFELGQIQQQEMVPDSFSPLSSGSSTTTIQTLPEVQEFKVEPINQKQKRRGKKKRRKKFKQKSEEEEGGFKKENSKERITFSDRVVRFALKYTRLPTRIISKRLPGLRDNLLRSNMRISPEGIISLALLFTFISIPVSIFGAFELWNFGIRPYALFVPAVSVVPFLVGITMPKISASSRAAALDNELPFLIAYITVLAGGGISPIVTLKRISKAAKIFPASAKEAARILLDIDIFGLDAISALERETRLTPNKTFSDFIGGYVSVLKTGGDALSYLEAKLKEIFNVRESKVKSGSEFIATMSEAYIITTVVMGVSLMVLWATQNLMSPNGLPTSGGTVNSTLIVMFSGFFVPVISLIFIIVIGSSQIREPYSYDLPFYIFLACMPVGALLYFLPLGLPIYYQLGLGLLAASTPPMVFQMMYKKRKESVEAKLSNFLRDLSEVRKTGLAPEKTIEQLANRNYGALTVHVKKIAAQVSWGTPLKTVLQTFIREVKSWISRAVAFLLLEVVDVGGGSAKMFISLADFTEKNAQLDKDRKSQIRPYIIIPYIGAILIVATTAMMVYYAGFSFQSFPGLPSNFTPSTALLTSATNTLLLAAFFQAWVMGFVAGKMGEGSAADGFKHATFLIAISMVTVLVTNSFIKL
jgi:archaeal flagellar protein FlaJ